MVNILGRQVHRLNITASKACEGFKGLCKVRKRRDQLRHSQSFWQAVTEFQERYYRSLIQKPMSIFNDLNIALPSFIRTTAQWTTEPAEALLVFTKTSALQPSFKIPQRPSIPSKRGHKPIKRGTLGPQIAQRRVIYQVLAPKSAPYVFICI